MWAEPGSGWSLLLQREGWFGKAESRPGGHCHGHCPGTTASVVEPSRAEGRRQGDLPLSGALPGPGQRAGVGLDAVPGSLQVSSRELVCHSCLKETLHKLEGMMRILQAETAAGTGTPTAIADSILNITGVDPGAPGPSPCPPPPLSFLSSPSPFSPFSLSPSFLPPPFSPPLSPPHLSSPPPCFLSLSPSPSLSFLSSPSPSRFPFSPLPRLLPPFPSPLPLSPPLSPPPDLRLSSQPLPIHR